MKTSTLRHLQQAQRDLAQLVKDGKAAAARPDAAHICRLGDEAIQRYETAENAIGNVMRSFPGDYASPAYLTLDEALEPSGSFNH